MRIVDNVCEDASDIPVTLTGVGENVARMLQMGYKENRKNIATHNRIVLQNLVSKMKPAPDHIVKMFVLNLSKRKLTFLHRTLYASEIKQNIPIVKEFENN